MTLKEVSTPSEPIFVGIEALQVPQRGLSRFYWQHSPYADISNSAIRESFITHVRHIEASLKGFSDILPDPLTKVIGVEEDLHKLLCLPSDCNIHILSTDRQQTLIQKDGTYALAVLKRYDGKSHIYLSELLFRDPNVEIEAREKCKFALIESVVGFLLAKEKVTKHPDSLPSKLAASLAGTNIDSSNDKTITDRVSATALMFSRRHLRSIIRILNKKEINSTLSIPTLKSILYGPFSNSRSTWKEKFKELPSIHQKQLESGYEFLRKVALEEVNRPFHEKIIFQLKDKVNLNLSSKEQKIRELSIRKKIERGFYSAASLSVEDLANPFQTLEAALWSHLTRQERINLISNRNVSYQIISLRASTMLDALEELQKDSFSSLPVLNKNGSIDANHILDYQMNRLIQRCNYLAKEYSKRQVGSDFEGSDLFALYVGNILSSVLTGDAKSDQQLKDTCEITLLPLLDRLRCNQWYNALGYACNKTWYPGHIVELRRHMNFAHAGFSMESRQEVLNCISRAWSSIASNVFEKSGRKKLPELNIDEKRYNSQFVKNEEILDIIKKSLSIPSELRNGAKLYIRTKKSGKQTLIQEADESSNKAYESLLKEIQEIIPVQSSLSNTELFYISQNLSIKYLEDAVKRFTSLGDKFNFYKGQIPRITQKQLDTLTSKIFVAIRPSDFLRARIVGPDPLKNIDEFYNNINEHIAGHIVINHKDEKYKIRSITEVEFPAKRRIKHNGDWINSRMVVELVQVQDVKEFDPNNTNTNKPIYLEIELQCITEFKLKEQFQGAPSEDDYALPHDRYKGIRTVSQRINFEPTLNSYDTIHPLAPDPILKGNFAKRFETLSRFVDKFGIFVVLKDDVSSTEERTYEILLPHKSTLVDLGCTKAARRFVKNPYTNEHILNGILDPINPGQIIAAHLLRRSPIITDEIRLSAKSLPRLSKLSLSNIDSNYLRSSTDIENDAFNILKEKFIFNFSDLSALSLNSSSPVSSEIKRWIKEYLIPTSEIDLKDFYSALCDKRTIKELLGSKRAKEVSSSRVTEPTVQDIFVEWVFQKAAEKFVLFNTEVQKSSDGCEAIINITSDVGPLGYNLHILNRRKEACQLSGTNIEILETRHIEPNGLSIRFSSVDSIKLQEFLDSFIPLIVLNPMKITSGTMRVIKDLTMTVYLDVANNEDTLIYLHEKLKNFRLSALDSKSSVIDGKAHVELTVAPLYHQQDSDLAVGNELDEDDINEAIKSLVQFADTLVSTIPTTNENLWFIESMPRVCSGF